MASIVSSIGTGIFCIVCFNSAFSCASVVSARRCRYCMSRGGIVAIVRRRAVSGGSSDILFLSNAVVGIVGWGETNA